MFDFDAMEAAAEGGSLKQALDEAEKNIDLPSEVSRNLFFKYMGAGTG